MKTTFILYTFEVMWLMLVLGRISIGFSPPLYIWILAAMIAIFAANNGFKLWNNLNE